MLNDVTLILEYVDELFTLLRVGVELSAEHRQFGSPCYYVGKGCSVPLAISRFPPTEQVVSARVVLCVPVPALSLGGYGESEGAGRRGTDLEGSPLTCCSASSTARKAIRPPATSSIPFYSQQN